MTNSQYIPLPIVLGGVGFMLAVAIPGGATGGVGFLIGLSAGVVLVFVMISLSALFEQRNLTKQTLAEIASLRQSLEDKGQASHSIKRQSEPSVTRTETTRHV